MLELFSGSGNMAAAFKAAGYTVATVDLECEATIKKDVRELTAQEVIDVLGIKIRNGQAVEAYRKALAWVLMAREQK